MIKIAVLCAILACAFAEETYSCISGAPVDGVDATIECTAADADSANCKGAISPAVANNTIGYGCGSCADNTAATCTTCLGGSTGTTKCNTYVTPTYTYTCRDLKTELDITCPDATSIHCFGPLEDYTIVAGEEALETGGCGECSATAYGSDKCEDCDYENCNSASALVSFLAPLLALLFWLQ